MGQSVLELSVAQGVGDWHDLWPWPLTYWPDINRGHLIIKDYLPTTFEACGAKRSWVISCTRWSRLAWPLTLTFDLLTWIIRDHLLIKDYLRTKFEASGSNRSWVISCTRLRDTDIPTDIPTDRPTDLCNAICPSFFEGGITTLKKRRTSMLKRHLILLKRINVEIWRWNNMELWRGNNIEIWRCFNVEIRRCFNVKFKTICNPYNHPSGYVYISGIRQKESLLSMQSSLKVRTLFLATA